MQTQHARPALVILALLCATLLCLALAAACAGDSEGDPSPTTNGAAPATSSVDSAETAAASATSEEEDREIAEKILLTRQDFPAGWSLERAKVETPLDVPPECQAFAGTLLKVGSLNFYGPDGWESVNSSAMVYTDARAAQQSFSSARDAFDRRRAPLLEALSGGLYQAYMQDGQQGEAGQSSSVPPMAMDWLPFPRYGDDGLAVRIRITLGIGDNSLDCYFDMFGWLVGRIEGNLGFSTCLDAPDQDEEQRLAQIIEERLKEAAKDLD